MNDELEAIHTRIWDEDAEPDNPFAAAAAHCHGYDVYGEILNKAGWAEYLYLLFKGERPHQWQAALLEKLAVALANPGPRDHSVRAAMNAGVGRSTSASTLMAALAVGAGNLGGAREVYVALTYWEACGRDIDRWTAYLRQPPQEERADIWIPMEHPPGFDPHGVSCTTPVRAVLSVLTGLAPEEGILRWLQDNREALESAAMMPLAMSGVAAAALAQIGFNADQAEMLYLMLRLPGAAVHGLEQREYGWRRYPFFHNGLVVPGSEEPSPERPAHDG